MAKPATTPLQKVRIDKWLWAARFYKSRTLAKEAIEGGKVHCNGQRVKVAKEVVVGDTLTIRVGHDKREVGVIALSEQRRGAAEAALLYTETPESLAAREQHAAERRAGNAGFTPAQGKPDKKSRRALNRFKSNPG